MWHLGTWFTGGLGRVKFVLGLDDLKSLFQLKWLCDSTILWFVTLGLLFPLQSPNEWNCFSPEKHLKTRVVLVWNCFNWWNFQMANIAPCQVFSWRTVEMQIWGFYMILIFLIMFHFGNQCKLSNASSLTFQVPSSCRYAIWCINLSFKYFFHECGVL